MSWSVHGVVAVGWQLWGIVQADGQIWVGAVGFRFGCWWCRWHRLACVGCVGWFLVGVSFELRRVWCERSTLAVQDLVCDGCRWVAVEGVFASVW